MTMDIETEDKTPKLELWDRVWPEVPEGVKDKAWDLLPSNFKNNSDTDYSWEDSWEDMWTDYIQWDDVTKFPSFRVQRGNVQDYFVYLDRVLGVPKEKEGWYPLSTAQYFFLYGVIPTEPCFHMCGDPECLNPLHLWSNKDGDTPIPSYPYTMAETILQ